MIYRCTEEECDCIKEGEKETYCPKCFGKMEKIEEKDMTGMDWCRLGIFFSEEGEEEKAFQCFSNSAKEGEPWGICNLGWCYETGAGVESDEKQAVWLYEQAISFHYMPAYCNLGWCYEHGIGVFVDFEQAAWCYRQSAEDNYARGQRLLANCYAYGNGVEQNEEMAFLLMEDAAENGDLDAIYYLGTFYWNGIGTEVHYERAVQIFRQLIEEIEDPDALFYLGYAYGNGTGTKKDLETSFAYYKRGALAGELTAKNNLADDYYLGRGTKKDIEQALFWYEESANDGNDDACCTLGRFYQEGVIVEKDLKTGADYYEQACNSKTENQGLECYLRMAFCYYMGFGRAQSETLGDRWLQEGLYKVQGQERLTKQILVRRNNGVCEGSIQKVVEQLIVHLKKRLDEIKQLKTEQKSYLQELLILLKRIQKYF